MPVALDMAGGLSLLLSGKNRLAKGELVAVVSAAVDPDAATPDQAALREALLRQTHPMADSAAIRDALFAHAKRHTQATLGPLTEDRMEPALQMARVTFLDLAVEEGVGEVGTLTRTSQGNITEYMAEVQVGGALCQVVLATTDGRRLQEGMVRQGLRHLATGIKPAGRALGRTLRQLAAELHS
jgi:hypothetical protein